MTPPHPTATRSGDVHLVNLSERSLLATSTGVECHAAVTVER